MSEDSEHRERRQADAALAQSSPDELTTFRGLINDFLGAAKGKLAFITTFFAGITLLIMAIAKFGTQSILALTALITSTMAYKAEQSAADRAVEIEKLKLSPISNEKLDQILKNTEDAALAAKQANLTSSALVETVEDVVERVEKIENSHRR